MEITKINKEKAWELRHKVMWPDKDLDYIKLEDDDLGIHFGLFKENILVSVISLFINNEEGQFRKFATLEQEQGKGYGSKLLDYVIKEAKDRGVKRIWCNARENKVNFYKKFGLEESNYRFTKGGKSYVIMEKDK
ncbi:MULTISPECIES: GNAT family N-acetyltransferase [Metabacillus]|uniref:GNAT family N-acetyltransferase n=1 Tax=Metabacillus rhizolycopersici TaxID=2875709 RepID=A0ABS7UYV7_9BACI|nr:MULTISPECIES: GNAT family N-acetyltransferase [Metabacillus]MBZ5753222.1 GNAT family N-acetyltransferase [Metabacillus rhizolycopersici]MCM3655130.1 GNAT family N-acetyltransferase [Metabacillus litoralis]